ncbi:HNH endonuclease signature motif containing protein [Mycobacterium kansasii]|uniref:HNH endonuclease signature motif containing protein n=1 Tax=Mycobacterium kansasii TaxID=1768 RepID=UPI0009F5F542
MECRFDSRAEVIAHCDDWFERRCPSKTAESAQLVERICAATRAENRAAAAQLVAIGELFAYRLSRCSETEDWAVDTMEAVAAEVAAALRISQGLAASRLRYARVMRERLPQVAEVFKAGEIDYLAFQTLAYRTDLIEDSAVLAAVDGELFVKLPRWPSMSRGRLGAQVDKIVANADADALRRRTKQQRDREICIDEVQGGISLIRGRLLSPHAHALEQRLDALANTVCPRDPRSRHQRRADALGALAAGADRLGCRCGHRECAAGTRPAATPVVIHVIAESAAVAGSGSITASEMGADGLITAELIAELAVSAKLVPLTHPGDAAPEPGYVPSKALADFVRCRDLTCRWPGCDRPASRCDLDHTIPVSQGGPTHASNLKCYCRTHHRTAKEPFSERHGHDRHTHHQQRPAGRRFARHPRASWRGVRRPMGRRHHQPPLSADHRRSPQHQREHQRSGVG